MNKLFTCFTELNHKKRFWHYITWTPNGSHNESQLTFEPFLYHFIFFDAEATNGRDITCLGQDSLGKEIVNINRSFPSINNG